MTPNPTLAGRLHNMTKEVERFKIPVAPDPTGAVWGQEASSTKKSQEAARMQEQLLEIPIGKRIEVLLLNGEKVRGRLLDATEQGFTLSLGNDTNREFNFDEVASVRKLGMRRVNKILIVVGICFVGPLLIGVATGSFGR
jgi:hypothetical protein